MGAAIAVSDLAEMRDFDIGQLAELFFQAAETERRLPPAIRKRTRANWPDYPDEFTGYGYTDAVLRLGPASARDIADYELALKLTPLMAEDERRVVWAAAHSAVRRARGPRWRALAKLLGCSSITVKRRFERALWGLWATLRAHK